jgi:hypothetical protein
MGGMYIAVFHRFPQQSIHDNKVILRVPQFVFCPQFFLMPFESGYAAQRLTGVSFAYGLKQGILVTVPVLDDLLR